MEQAQITINDIYEELKRLELALQRKGVVKEEDIQASELEPALFSEKALSEGWLSPEDEEAFAYLQENETQQI